MANRDVAFARLQGPAFVQGVGQFGPEIIPVVAGGGKIKNLSMVWSETTLDIMVNGIEVGIPHANIQCVTFKNQEVKPTLAVTKAK